MLAAPMLVAEVIEKGPIGAMTREVAELVGDPERTGVVVVTLAEEMPVTEALELRQTLAERLDREPDLLVVNGLYPPAGRATGGDEALELWRRRRAVNERELERLGAEWAGARAELPLLPLGRGVELVAGLSDALRQSLATGAPDEPRQLTRAAGDRGRRWGSRQDHPRRRARATGRPRRAPTRW